jgi:hypothetical protein
MGLPFTIAAGPRQRSHSQVPNPAVLMTIFYGLGFELHQPGGPGPVARLHPQTLGSPYDSQGYSVSIRTPWHGPSRKHRFQEFLYCRAWEPVRFAAVT